MSRSLLMPLLLVAAAGSLSACVAPVDDPAVSVEAAVEADPWREQFTRDGRVRVRWRAVERELGPNRMAELEVRLERVDGDQPVEGATVAVSAFMPGHGHGTNLVPVTTELGEGRYRIEGLLLHMAGAWELHVDVVEGGLASRATFELML